MRSLVFKIRMECDECGSNLFVDGPVREIRCTACAAQLEIAHDTWKYLIVTFMNDYDSLASGPSNGTLTSRGRRTVFQVAQERPRCNECGDVFDVAALLSDRDGRVFCGRCGAATTSHAVPDWLTRGLEGLVRLVGVPQADAAEPAAVALKPVVMSCLNCGAKLEIDSDALRIIECTFCKTDHYVPDDVWRRLHPIRRRRAWYALF